MRRSLPRSLGVLVLSVFLVAPAQAGDVKAKSPENTFKGFAAAVKKEDVKAVLSYLTRDSQSAIAGYMLALAALMSSPEFDKQIETEDRKALEDVLKRHSISSEDALRKIPEDRWFLLEEVTGDKFPKNLVALGDLVKDKPAFVADFLKAFPKHPGLDMKSLKEIGQASIKDVKIEGEQAKGQVTIPSAGGKETTRTYYFKLEDRVWKIDAIETYRKIPPPPPAEVKAPAQVQRQAAPSYSRPGPLRRLLNRLFN